MAYAKMNPEVKQKWIDALRSGKYNQGKGQLRNAYDEFCCLGVLCNIHAQEHPEFAANQISAESYDGSLYCLGSRVLAWSEVAAGARDRLVTMNDCGYRSFEQIANWIEKNL